MTQTSNVWYIFGCECHHFELCLQAGADQLQQKLAESTAQLSNHQEELHSLKAELQAATHHLQVAFSNTRFYKHGSLPSSSCCNMSRNSNIEARAKHDICMCSTEFTGRGNQMTYMLDASVIDSCTS